MMLKSQKYQHTIAESDDVCYVFGFCLKQLNDRLLSRGLVANCSKSNDRNIPQFWRLRTL